MLHCVMESETPCAPLLLALNTERVILKTSLIYETAINSQRNPLTQLTRPALQAVGSVDLLFDVGGFLHMSLLPAAVVAASE